MGQHNVFILTLLLCLQPLAWSNGDVSVSQSVSFESFGADVQHVYEPQKDQSGVNLQASYPDDPPFPPADPVHDNDDKFRIHCDLYFPSPCTDVFTTSLTWNTAYPGHIKTCSVQVKLEAYSNGSGMSKSHTYTTSGDCSITKTTSDGIELWVVHPKTLAEARTLVLTFTGHFNPLDAAIWSNQIYAHLNATFAGLTQYYTGSYNVSSDGSSLTIKVPTYYELPYA